MKITIAKIDKAFDAIHPDAIGTGCDANGNPDGSDSWDHPSAEAARKITAALGIVWDFATWDEARAIAYRSTTLKMEEES